MPRQTSLRLGELRFNYTNIFEPARYENGKPVYSTEFLVPAHDVDTILKMTEIALKCGVEVRIRPPRKGVA